MRLRSVHLRTIVLSLTALQFGLMVWFTVHMSHELPGALVAIQKPAPTYTPQQASLLLTQLPLTPPVLEERSIVAVNIGNSEQDRIKDQGLKQALLIQESALRGSDSHLTAYIDAANVSQSLGPLTSLEPDMEKVVLQWSSVAIDADDGTFVTPSQLQEYMRMKDLKPQSWPPYTTGTIEGNGQPASFIDIQFFNPRQNVRLTYDELHGTYLRSQGNVVRQAMPKNVLILEWNEQNSGPFMLFQDGAMHEGIWTYTEHEGLSFSLPLAYGQTWITMLQRLDRVDFGVINEEKNKNGVTL